MSNQPRILLVCDADDKQGSGHVMRMITLGALMIERGAHVTIAANTLPESLSNLALHRGLQLTLRRHKQADSSLAREIQTRRYSAIIFDGYEFDRCVFEELMERDENVVIIDDNGDHAAVPCSMIVNPNLHATDTTYAVNTSRPVLLLGVKYALIRPEVRAVAVLPIQERSGVILSLGGSDVLGRRAQIEQHLRHHLPWSVATAVGLIGSQITSVAAMAKSLAASRVGVIAVGTTTWEALYLGLPIVGVVVAQNQVLISNSLITFGLAEMFDIRNEFDLTAITQAVHNLYNSVDLLKQRSNHGRTLVDGLGAERVAETVLAL